MQKKTLTPHKAVNKSFLKLKPSRKQIDHFKENFIDLFEKINDNESEEFQKNLIADFLKKNSFDPHFYINTKGRNDLVIHNDKTAKSNVGVIIETKKITNSAEMLSVKKLNVKAFQELLLYYLRERITHKNLEVKHLIATNVYEWFIFDANQFEHFFGKNKKLIKQFEDFEANRLSGNTTDFFYTEIAKPAIDEVVELFEYTYFNLKDYESIVKNTFTEDDNKLIAIFKIFSPEHLLKLPFINDSNTLDKGFYNELLHIIGLVETKDAGKRLIERNIPNKRNSGSLLEDTIIQLDSLDKVNRISKPFLYGGSYEERLFNIALELNITWVNRILFLKLMEGQLIKYHKGDKSFSFLNYNKIKQFDDLNTLFFQVLAKRFEERNDDVKKAFEKVPYLNSSLFEPTELEHSTLMISNLRDEKKIPILSATVLKDDAGKKRIGELNTLEYLFAFLDAYDFSSEGSEDILEENKTLINASVLGLIFEKINGYKDGSFYTPGFITMYMCKETLRKSVIQKFNEIKEWNCLTIIDLHNKIDDVKEANEIINSIRICDPAVGSGHFLVSALNEFIAIKNDLGILVDKNGKKLKNFHIEVQNDELIITDEDGELFEYFPKSPESQRIQETLFHEKQTIIENCLFGVDINPNSVKICRLRLWIELLKNAYYKNDKELETLPNIDINIKNGNSLVHRFDLNTSLSTALKTAKISIQEYKKTVFDYKNTESKAQKRELESFLQNIKNCFKSEISINSREMKALNLLRAEYFTKYQAVQLFGIETLSKAQQKHKSELESKISKFENYIEEIKNNKIYENAFEWRFEFPEVLDNEGNFIGFDAIIGNPPYIQLQKMGEESDILQQMEYETYTKTGDIYSLFYELGYDILKPKGTLTYITSNKWMRAAYGESLRNFFAEKTNPDILIDFSGNQIFDTATVDTNILMFSKEENKQETHACVVKEKLLINLGDYFRQNSTKTKFINKESWVVLSEIEQRIKAKVEAVGTPLKDWDINIYRGILTGYNEAFIIDGKKKDELIAKDPKSAEIIRPILRGRDIKKYSYDFADLWLIYIPWHFPLHLDTNIKGASQEAENQFRIQYPAIYNHLLKYKTELSNRNKAETGVRYEWYALQRWGANYWEDFYKQKIVWKIIGNQLAFSIDKENFIVNNACYILTGQDLEYLVVFLNSKIIKWYSDLTNMNKTGVGDVQLGAQNIVLFPIPKIHEKNQQEFKDVLLKILSVNDNRKSFNFYESVANKFVNSYYQLTDEEIQFIESQ